MAIAALDETAYAALNALTWVASHTDRLTLAERRGLARLAGVLAFRHEHLCPRCFSILRVGAANAAQPAER